MAENASIGFACTCGQVCGHLVGVTPASGTHLVCHCRDCRAAEIYLGQPDPGTDGVALFQTTPDKVRFDTGAERLAVIRLGPKGPLRWYAECCKAPLFNTLASPGVPFSTIVVARLADPDALGPVRARAFVPVQGGAARHKGAGLMVWRLVTGMGAARLSGRWRQTPFFDLDTKEPKAPVHLLGKTERDALYS